MYTPTYTKKKKKLKLESKTWDLVRLLFTIRVRPWLHDIKLFKMHDVAKFTYKIDKCPYVINFIYLNLLFFFLIIHKYVFFFLLYNDSMDDDVYQMINDSTTWHYPINLKLKILNKITPRVQVLSRRLDKCSSNHLPPCSGLMILHLYSYYTHINWGTAESASNQHV